MHEKVETGTSLDDSAMELLATFFANSIITARREETNTNKDPGVELSLAEKSGGGGH